MQHFGTVSVKERAEKAYQRLNLFHCSLGGETSNGVKRKRATYKNCLLVWDTEASSGLTPFCCDFIDYVECNIPVHDIARTNMVIDIGTTLHKFKINGEDIFIPCLSYHLPSAEVQLFSPQTYHTLYGGHSAVFGNHVDMFIDHLKIAVEIGGYASNVPTVYDCSVSPKEMEEHGPHIRSALHQCERKVDFLGGWSSQHFYDWKVATAEIDQEYGHYCCPSRNVGSKANTSLTSAQNELLLWHWKLSIGMKRVQEMMSVVEAREPNGRTLTMDCVITPKIKAAATCPIPLCQSCQLARAKERRPNVTKSTNIPSSQGRISSDQYETGYFVSMDQYVVKTPGRLPTGFGNGSHVDIFHGGTIFRDAASKAIYVQNQVSLGAGVTIKIRCNFRNGYGRRLMQRSNTITVTTAFSQLRLSNNLVRKKIRPNHSVELVLNIKMQRQSEPYRLLCIWLGHS